MEYYYKQHNHDYKPHYLLLKMDAGRNIKVHGTHLPKPGAGFMYRLDNRGGKTILQLLTGTGMQKFSGASMTSSLPPRKIYTRLDWIHHPRHVITPTDQLALLSPEFYIIEKINSPLLFLISCLLLVSK